MNNKNLWIYSNNQEQVKTANNLIIYGAEQLKSAQIISQLDLLKETFDKHGSKPIPLLIQEKRILPLIFSWLIDSVKIIIFFENYMKAELLKGDFLVHKIESTLDDYKIIKREQKKRPIKLIELHKIQPYLIDVEKQVIDHEALSFKTLGFSELTKKKAYTSIYQFDSKTLEFLKSINRQRNKLHFLDGLNFQLSRDLIDNLSNIDNFAQETVSRIFHYHQ